MRWNAGRLVVALGLLIATRVWCSDVPDFSEPILLTSCGQSSDALMVKIIMAKDSLDFTYAPAATVADLEGKKTLVLVIGGSSKGLGAAKISVEDEMKRVSALLDAAKEAKIPVVALHVGGQARRGDLSDPFNRLGAARAHRMVVVKGGNDDGFFSKICEEGNIQFETTETVNQLGSVLKRIFRAEE